MGVDFPGDPLRTSAEHQPCFLHPRHLLSDGSRLRVQFDQILPEEGLSKAADLNLTEFKLDFLRIASHEHYVTLNLPLGATIHHIGAGSQASSPSGETKAYFLQG